MSRRLSTFFVAFAAVTACTERNPEYCGDGTCVDPAKPYCDVDGTFSDIPGTCIAVECTPDAFAYCRGDIAITCSDNGTNYDNVKCPLGCDPAAAGCVECMSNAQCTGAFVCDTVTSHCGPCTSDDQCDSRVCDLSAGTCVSENAIVYAAPGGNGPCSLAQPCSLQQAYVTAANASPLPIVRMLPGNYTTSLRADVPTSAPLKIVAKGANMVVIGSAAAIVVEAGASIRIRDLTSTSERQVQCGLASNFAPLSAVALENSSLTMVGAGIGFEIQRCELDVRNVNLSTNVDILATRNESVFKADQFHVRGTPGNLYSIIIGGSHVAVDVVNSLFEDTHVVGFVSDTAPASFIRFAYSTFLLANSLSLCSGPTPTFLSVTFENSILASRGAFDALSNVNPANCTFVSTILTRQASPPNGTMVSDPLFVDQAGRNFRLMSNSPAVDAGSPATVNSDHDVEGTARPQGGKPDVGAYELRP